MSISRRCVRHLIVLCLCFGLPPLANAAVSPEPFAKLPEFSGATLSPKGDRLAVQMRVDGRVRLNILSLETMKSIGGFGLHPGARGCR